MPCQIIASWANSGDAQLLFARHSSCPGNSNLNWSQLLRKVPNPMMSCVLTGLLNPADCPASATAEAFLPLHGNIRCRRRFGELRIRSAVGKGQPSPGGISGIACKLLSGCGINGITTFQPGSRLPLQPARATFYSVASSPMPPSAVTKKSRAPFRRNTCSGSILRASASRLCIPAATTQLNQPPRIQVAIRLRF